MLDAALCGADLWGGGGGEWRSSGTSACYLCMFIFPARFVHVPPRQTVALVGSCTFAVYLFAATADAYRMFPHWIQYQANFSNVGMLSLVSNVVAVCFGYDDDCVVVERYYWVVVICHAISLLFSSSLYHLETAAKTQTHPGDRNNAESLISTETFCKIFPFHVMFDKRMQIVQVGNSVSRIIPRWVCVCMPKYPKITRRHRH